MKDHLDKAKLLDLMRAEYAFANRTLALVPENLIDTPGVQGDWSVKDMIAHLTAWQRRTLNWIHAARRSEGIPGKHPIEPETGFGWDEKDAINAQDYERDKNRPLPEVLAEFKTTYEQLYTIAEASSDDELFGRDGVSRFFRDPLFNYVAGNTYLHYDEHIPAIRLWLREVAKYRTAEGRTLLDL